MKPTERDVAYLWDMLNACRETVSFTQATDFEHFIADRKLCLAVERSLEIVGEAAGRVSEAFRASHSSIPWVRIKGMRNILAHEYGEIDYEIIYRTAKQEIPGLIGLLQAELPVE